MYQGYPSTLGPHGRNRRRCGCHGALRGVASGAGRCRGRRPRTVLRRTSPRFVARSDAGVPHPLRRPGLRTEGASGDPAVARAQVGVGHRAASNDGRRAGGRCAGVGTVARRSRVVRERAEILGAGVPWLDTDGAPALWVENIGVIAADATVSALAEVSHVPVIEDARVVAIDAG